MRKALVIAALLALTGCINSPPPADLLANEVIDSLDEPESVKECMRQAVAGFSGFDRFDSLDDAAAKAAEGNEDAKAVIANFEAALAKCK